jgi:hypothetical protein
MFLVLSHMFGYLWSKNYWADSESFVFLKSKMATMAAAELVINRNLPPVTPNNGPVNEGVRQMIDGNKTQDGCCGGHVE